MVSQQDSPGVPSRAVRHWALLATVLYCIWGITRLSVGASLAFDGLSAGLHQEEELPAQSAMFFLCMAAFGAQAICVALALNQHNSPVGYWLNLLVLGAVDLAYVAVIVIPGHVEPVAGALWPVTWALASIAATLARLLGRAKP